jgi:hypothetical protein
MTDSLESLRDELDHMLIENEFGLPPIVLPELELWDMMSDEAQAAYELGYYTAMREHA